MTDKNDNKKGCSTMTILVSIGIVGLIARFFIDKEDLFKDIWFGLLSIVIIIIVIWIVKTNNFRF